MTAFKQGDKVRVGETYPRKGSVGDVISVEGDEVEVCFLPPLGGSIIVCYQRDELELVSRADELESAK